MTEKKRKEIVDASKKISHDIVSSHSKNGYQFDVHSEDIEKAFDFYEILKDEVKNKISQTTFNQDRHKIASVAVIAIMWYLPLKVTKAPSAINDVEAKTFINQIFAFAVAEEIIFSFLNDSNSALRVPATTGSGKQYIDYLFGLIDSMISNTKFDQDGDEIAKKTNNITSLSHIFYLLERYSLDFK